MRFLSDFFRNRGQRVITCPENKEGAVVRIDALRAARTGEVRLADCTRWPEQAGCAEGCLTEIKASPHGCLVHAIVADWYLGKSCVMCRRPIGTISWHEAPPAVLKADGTTAEWTDVPLQNLPVIFRESKPICWYCNNVADVERLNPALITHRNVPVEPAQPVLKNDNVY